MEIQYGRPFHGQALARLTSFLAAQGLSYAEDIEFTVNLLEGQRLIATGSLAGGVLKCLAVEKDRQGQGLMAVLVTELRREAFALGREELLVFTKPANSLLFEYLGFSFIAATADVCLLESQPRGIERFAEKIAREAAAKLDGGGSGGGGSGANLGPGGSCPGGPDGGTSADGPSGDPGAAKPIGCVIANADPFTKGHRHLVETAAGACRRLYLLILSEDRGLFSAADRLALARANTADLANVFVHPTGPYQVSQATFPEYFIRDKARLKEISCRLDLTIFAQRLAPALGVTRRFVGEEPLSAVTREYNEQMKAFLPGRGIAVTEVPRLQAAGGPISASRVRELWRAGRLEALAPFVPEATWLFLSRKAAEAAH